MRAARAGAAAYAMVGTQRVNVLVEEIGPELLADELDDIDRILKAW